MKKLFLVLGLSGICTTAFSQQQEFFNAQKHLQKKAKLYQKAGGKPIARKFSFPLPKTVFPLRPAPVNILPNGDLLYYLPADNMPCVSPDMTRYRAMPNADKDIHRFILRQRRGLSIHNPALPFSLTGTW